MHGDPGQLASGSRHRREVVAGHGIEGDCSAKGGTTEGGGLGRGGGLARRERPARRSRPRWSLLGGTYLGRETILQRLVPDLERGKRDTRRWSSASPPLWVNFRQSRALRPSSIFGLLLHRELTFGPSTLRGICGRGHDEKQVLLSPHNPSFRIRFAPALTERSCEQQKHIVRPR